MKKVGSYEAKTHLPQLLEEVAKGEQITITKHGVPIAKLIPAHPEKGRNLQRVIAEIREFRERHPLKGLSIRKMIEEGRRF
jgi:prevent-host-death family protein